MCVSLSFMCLETGLADRVFQALPALREECQQSAKCAPLTKHFQHCQEKVEGGEGFKGEDCVEELCVRLPVLF